jgi:hypothetical protein
MAGHAVHERGDANLLSHVKRGSNGVYSDDLQQCRVCTYIFINIMSKWKSYAHEYQVVL